MFHRHIIPSISLTLIATFAPSVAAQACRTEVRNDITADQTWTPAGSPYCVTARIKITATLTIRPGVVVKGSENNFITVADTGKILAIGTPSAPIAFTAIDPAKPWRGIGFGTRAAGVTTPAALGSILSHCQFSGVKISAAITMQETPVTVDNCTFSSSDRGGISVILSTGDLTIRDCTFSKNPALRPLSTQLKAQMAAGNLTVVDCTFSDNGGPSGGLAINASIPTGELIVTNCTFSNNQGLGQTGTSGAGGFGGGAILFTGKTLRVSGSAFIGNSIDAGLGIQTGIDAGGGAIYLQGDAVIDQSSFESNRARGHRVSQTAIGRGGAICNVGGNTTLTNCKFTDNLVEGSFENIGVNGRAFALGGAVYSSFGTLQAINCLFSGNRTSVDGTTVTEEHGAAIYSEGFFPTDLVNCTVTRGATVGGADGGLYFAGGTATIRNSILWGNAGAEIAGGGAATVTFSNVEGTTVYPGKGNINVDPAFATGSIGAEIIGAGSPCIDAGDPAPADDDVCFPPSLGGARNDMGAHGGPLACGWSAVPATRFYLSTSAGNLTTPAPLHLMLAGGVPGSPAALFITGVNHSPVLVGLPVLLMVELEGTASLQLNVPVMPFGSTLDFQGFSLTTGGLESTNTANVIFQ